MERRKTIVTFYVKPYLAEYAKRIMGSDTVDLNTLQMIGLCASACMAWTGHKPRAQRNSISAFSAKRKALRFVVSRDQAQQYIRKPFGHEALKEFTPKHEHQARFERMIDGLLMHALNTHMAVYRQLHPDCTEIEAIRSFLNEHDLSADEYAVRFRRWYARLHFRLWYAKPAGNIPPTTGLAA